MKIELDAKQINEVTKKKIAALERIKMCAESLVDALDDYELVNLPYGV